MIAPVLVSITPVQYHLLLMTCQILFYSFTSFKQITYFMQIDHMIWECFKHQNLKIHRSKTFP